MSGLAELERTVKEERKRLQNQRSGVVVKRKPTKHTTARQLARRRTRALSTKINYSVPDVENIDVIAQPSKTTCWATVFTMMYGWKTGTCLNIESALSNVAPRWVEIFKDNKGLMPDDKKDFVAAAGLVAEPPMSLSVIGWEKLLRDYGPIWVTTDEAPGKPWAIHARIIVAIRGDGTPAGTKFKIIDPAGGREYTETIATFVPKYEEEVRQTGYTRIQILHWPKDARYGAIKSMAAYREPPAHALAGEQCFGIRYNVDLVPQQTGMSCWAASAAMIVGWDDQICFDPYAIARAIGYWKQYEKGLNVQDTTMFKVWGLTREPPQCYTVDGFRELLEQYGPLWVVTDEPGIHARVVTGMEGDGTFDGTILYINDPWERGMKAFKPSNKGSSYTETYRQFAQKQSSYGYKVMKVDNPITVAHLPQLPSWYKGPTSQSYSQFFGKPLAMEVPSNPSNYRLLTSGTWNSNTTLNVQGGQSMWFKVTNTNILGTTIRISDNLGQSKASVILPQTTVNFLFTCFGNEPMSWSFDIRSESDAFMVTWELWSTWAPGMPHNPPSPKGVNQTIK